MPDVPELSAAMLEVVRERMDEQGLSGRALAGQIGLNPVTFSLHLRGEGKIPLEEWEAIAYALGANRLEELLVDARKRL